jgi:regulator of sigma E protease
MLVTIIIFLIILSVLVFVHELGHFVTAKINGVRVDEFGLGYPPRAKALFTWRGTTFTLNWLPFGGFVRIFGENPEEDGSSEENKESLTAKPKRVQAAVLVAGVFMNLVFAWLIISLGYTLGLPSSADSGLPLQNTYTVVTEVVENSPAQIAGVKVGDKIVSVSRNNLYANLSPEQISNFIASSPTSLNLVVERGSSEQTLKILPSASIVSGKMAIGVGLDAVGLAKLSPLKALWEGLKVTTNLTWLTFKGLLTFIRDAFIGHANLSEVTGPVGIVGLVGDAKGLGFTFLLSLTALISINLAIINLLPIPALDGGRLLFIAIEAIRGKKISTRVQQILNGVSFALLILLMIIITIRDVIHLL